ncbi:MAG: serine/threonine protein kinase [Myxococcales bacterium]|nr:serine/threonine protein kinase [Myxococcales bacterium]
MGLVYAAYDPELDRKIAVKVVRLRSGIGPSWLIREAQAMARLSHPNVVTVHDVGTIGDAVFIAMEFVEGVTLREWLLGHTSEETVPSWSHDGHRARPWQEVLARFIKAGRGLAAAHAAGVVHRDFKPDNVLVGRDGRVKVLDFGLAQGPGDVELGEPGVAAPEGAALTVSTQLGGVIGTPAYMAPEQHAGGVCDARADQFSFCVSLWEGLHGVRPFAGVTPSELAEATRRGEIQPPPRDSRVPRWLHRVLLRGLASDPAARYPDMRALLADLGRDHGRTQNLWLVGAAAAVLGLAASLASLEPPAPRPEAQSEVLLRSIESKLKALERREAQSECACPAEAPPSEAAGADRADQ